MLVAELREDGYLDATLDEIAAETGMAPDLLEQALAALQACEPPGIGARDLPECLALQLVAQGYAPSLSRAICTHLEDFAESRWSRLSRALPLQAEALARLAALLPTLRPAPALPDPGPALPLLAELIVEPGLDGSPQVRLNQSALPVLGVAARVTGGSSELARAQAEAGFLAAALRARAATLLRIGTHLVTVQARHFASAGDQPLLPMTRAEAAAALSMHPATLGRAISGKALSAFGRTLPIEGFFSHGLPGRGGTVSAHQVQRRIRALIAAEPPDAPLADDAICAHLQKEGVDIARRTVAKYRTCMRIASSFERRRRKVITDRSAKSSAMNPPRY
ncbi:RNA polymerase sigma-54 factor [Frigidibacter mobilis]|uniref:RNA polymerase sigma-54 factor n=2 Tax=Frigidibacter mobilis TaxID=1335048 RepID=A0A159Z7V5_9RHOB|nr:RNA polymerase sigma-54 factor [Frigidibacter mobilis]